MDTLADTLKQQIESTEEYIDINEVASVLSISTATVRNWMKANKLQPQAKMGRRLVFDKACIYKIKEEIQTDKFQRLKSRRNKHAIKGSAIPSEYVNYTPYVVLAEKICAITQEMKNDNKIELVLFEVSLNLLKYKGHLIFPHVEKGSSTREVVNEKIQLGEYGPLLNELFHYRDYPVIESDFQQLEQIFQLNIPFVEGEDFLGLLYLSLTNMGKRKTSGSYYTPTNIVQFLTDKTFDIENHQRIPLIIDPCCGSGNFLIKVFLHLKKHAIDSGKSLKDAEKAVLDHLTGIDIDKLAVTLTKINLALQMESRLHSGVSFLVHCQNTLESTLPSQHYDIVIGNPPWGCHFSGEEIERHKQTYATAQASLESFSLFIECGINLLKDNGILSFVLPESLLNVKLHAKIRKIVLDCTQIEVIKVLGDQFTNVFAPAITLTVRKQKHQRDHRVIVLNDFNEEKINQDRFFSNEQYILNVKASNIEGEIIEHMKHLPEANFLKENADFALGIVTGNNKEYVFSTKPSAGEPVLKGSNVLKYNYYSGDHYICFEPKKFQQVAPEKMYRADEKLLYRFINANLIFAYDDRQVLSLNSANVLIPSLEGYEVKYILAVLNSRAAQFFHTLSFSSVKVLRKHIESIPTPFCDIDQQHQLINDVDKLMASSDPKNRQTLYETIDDKVMDLFEFTIEQRSVIKSKVNHIKFLSR